MRGIILFLLFFPGPLFSQEWKPMGTISGKYGSPILHNDLLYIVGQTLQFKRGLFEIKGNNVTNIFCTNNQFNYANRIISFGNKIIVHGNVDICMQDTNQNKSNVYMAEWDGLYWNEIPIGNESLVINAMCVYKGELYVAGNFRDINGITYVNRIARWDGLTWKKVGNGLTGGLTTVQSMCVYNNELYVAGNFSNASGVPVQNIAKWNGISWSAVGNGCSGYMRAMVVNPINNELIVAGEFEYVDNTLKTIGFAKWNGNKWSKMSNDRVLGVMDLAYYRNRLFVASSERSVLNNMDTLEHLYTYNESDSTWHSVLEGTNSTIANLFNYGDSLLVLGGFTKPYPGIVAYYESPVGVNQEYKFKRDFLSPSIPNPTSRITRFEYSTEFDNVYLVIFDFFGNELEVIKLNDRKGKIDYSFPEKTPPGIYYISLYAEGVRYATQKIILN